MPPALEDLQRALSDRYLFERELGRGGMAAVYLAEDLKHRRLVALKVLDPQVAAALGPERFLREIEIAARLNHPHILPLHDSGQAGGCLFYVMPYVEGESLRDRLRREKQLEIPEALRIAREVADALDYAHRRSVIHRDIKPENILLSEGHAVVADFGIARAVQAAGAHTLTGPAAIVGTPAYMSPEQISPAATLDGRADIYSLGCVLHEMLAGTPPFLGATVDSVLRQHLAVDPPSVHVIRPAIPLSTAGVVARALAKAPADRHRTAAEFSSALAQVEAGRTPRGARSPTRSRLGLATALAAAVVVLVVATLRLQRPSSPALDPRRILVSVFENQTGDASLDPLGRMAADWITQGLAQTGLVEVVPWSTALRSYQNVNSAAAPDPAGVEALAEETGAGVVISGAYYRRGPEVHFVARLTDAREGKVLRGLEPVRAPWKDPTAALERLRQRLIAALAALRNPRLATSSTVTAQPPSYAAYREYAEGMELYVQRRPAEAIPHFYQAAASDSTFVMPLLFAGIAHSNLGQYESADSIARVVSRSRERLAPYEQAWLDWLIGYARSDWNAMLAAARRAAEIAPGSKASYNVALHALDLNRPREAVAALSRLDPEKGEMAGWWLYWQVLTQARHLIGEYQAELRDARRARHQYPDRILIVECELRALAALNRANEVEDVLEESATMPHQVEPLERVTHADLLERTAIELKVHGDPGLARRLLLRAVAAYRSLPAAERAGPRPQLARVLYHAERWAEAESLYRDLARQDPANPEYQGRLGCLAARAGRREEARRIENGLRRLRRSPGQGIACWHARIACLLGEPGRAAEHMRECIDRGSQDPLDLHRDPDLETIRRTPGFRDLTRPRG